jgi:hypothetical protein
MILALTLALAATLSTSQTTLQNLQRKEDLDLILMESGSSLPLLEQPQMHLFKEVSKTTHVLVTAAVRMIMIQANQLKGQELVNIHPKASG